MAVVTSAGVKAAIDPPPFPPRWSAFRQLLVVGGAL
jgi:hypothetical protein